MSDTDYYLFFSYYNKARREGLTDMEAYRYALTEDIYDVEGVLLSADAPRPDGMCHHPQRFVEDHNGDKLCGICGLVLRRGAGQPVKMLTRMDCFVATMIRASRM